MNENNDNEISGLTEPDMLIIQGTKRGEMVTIGVVETSNIQIERPANCVAQGGMMPAALIGLALHDRIAALEAKITALEAKIADPRVVIEKAGGVGGMHFHKDGGFTPTGALASEGSEDLHLTSGPVIRDGTLGSPITIEVSAQDELKCGWCGGLMGADEDTCQHEDCGRGSKTEAMSAQDDMPTEIDSQVAEFIARERWPVTWDGVLVTLKDGKLWVRPHPSIADRHEREIATMRAAVRFEHAVRRTLSLCPDGHIMSEELQEMLDESKEPS